MLDWLADDGEAAEDGHVPGQGPEPWKILIVDDEEEVHRVTRLALRRFKYEGRPVSLLKASSGAEACTLVEKNPDLAVVFLDVVMETDDAGLKVIDYIRNELHNSVVRIIVRTGQAGRAPEISVVAKYDINGYREKTELTSDKLLSQLYTALSSYRDLITLNSEMSRRREAANKLVQQFAQLQEANRRLEHFAKAASHDLQEPLRKIQLWADRLVGMIDTDNNPSANEIAQKLIGSTQKISTMVDEIKQSSMLESGQGSFEEVYLGNLIAEVLEDVAEDVGERQPQFSVGELPSIQADRASLKLMFTNLIEDIALSDPEQGDVNVSIRLGKAQQGQVEIIISDNGYGIEPGEIEKLFDPYSSVVINKIPCRTLGLYLSKRIVEVHGGNISASSAVGEGTEIRVELPREYVETKDQLQTLLD